jgi:hypothetical protein
LKPIASTHNLQRLSRGAPCCRPKSAEYDKSGLAPGTVVITGGAEGPDRWAEQVARTRGFEVVVHRPDLGGVHGRWEAAERFYARNQRIVDDSDLVIAFVAPDRAGGTEDTIRRAPRREAGREVR